MKLQGFSKWYWHFWRAVFEIFYCKAVAIGQLEWFSVQQRAPPTFLYQKFEINQDWGLCSNICFNSEPDSGSEIWCRCSAFRI